MTRLLISMPGDTERNPHLIFFFFNYYYSACIVLIQPGEDEK